MCDARVAVVAAVGFARGHAVVGFARVAVVVDFAPGYCSVVLLVYPADSSVLVVVVVAGYCSAVGFARGHAVVVAGYCSWGATSQEGELEQPSLVRV